MSSGDPRLRSTVTTRGGPETPSGVAVSLWLGLELLEHGGIVGGCPLLEDRPWSSITKMSSSCQTTLCPLGCRGPTGDWVELRDEGPSIQVWQAMMSPSTTTMSRWIQQSSNPAYRSEVVERPSKSATNLAVELEPASEVIGDRFDVLAGHLDLTGAYQRRPAVTCDDVPWKSS